MILFFMLPAQAQFFKKLRNKVNKVESNINDNPQENKNAENTSAIKSDGSHSDNLSKIDFAKAKIETKTILDKGAQYGFGNYRGNMTPALYLPLNDDWTPPLIPYYSISVVGTTGDISDNATILVQKNGQPAVQMSLADFESLADPYLNKEQNEIDGITNGITDDDKKLLTMNSSVSGGAFEITVGGKKYSYHSIYALRTDMSHQRFFALVRPLSTMDFQPHLVSSAGINIQMPINTNELRVNENVTNAFAYGAAQKGIVFADGKKMENYDNSLISQSWLSPLGDNVFGLSANPGTYLNGKKIAPVSANPGYAWSDESGTVWAFLRGGDMDTNIKTHTDARGDQQLIFSDGTTISGNIGTPKLITQNKKLYLVWLMFSKSDNKIIVCKKEM